MDGARACMDLKFVKTAPKASSLKQIRWTRGEHSEVPKPDQISQGRGAVRASGPSVVFAAAAVAVDGWAWVSLNT